MNLKIVRSSFLLFCHFHLFLVWLDRNLMSGTSPQVLWQVPIIGLVTWTMVVMCVVALVAVVTHWGNAV